MAHRLMGALRASLPRLVEVDLPSTAGAGNGDEGELTAVVRGARAYLLQTSTDVFMISAGGGYKGSLERIVRGAKAYTLQAGAQEFLPYTAASLMEGALPNPRFAPSDSSYADENALCQNLQMYDKFIVKVATEGFVYKGSLELITRRAKAYSLQAGAQEFLLYSASSLMEHALPNARFAKELIHDDASYAHENAWCQNLQMYNKFIVKVTTECFNLFPPGKMNLGEYYLPPGKMNWGGCYLPLVYSSVAIGTAFRFYSSRRTVSATRRRQPNLRNGVDWSVWTPLDRFLKDMGYTARGPFSRAAFVFIVACHGFREFANFCDEASSAVGWISEHRLEVKEWVKDYLAGVLCSMGEVETWL